MELHPLQVSTPPKLPAKKKPETCTDFSADVRDRITEATIGNPKKTKKRKVFGAEKWMEDDISFWDGSFSGALIVSFREGTTYNFFFRIRDFSFDSSIFGMPASFRWP